MTDAPQPRTRLTRLGVLLALVVVPLLLLAMSLPPTKGKWAPKKRDWAGGGAIVLAIASGVAYFVPNPLFPRRRSALPLIVLGASLLVIGNWVWNRAFLDYTSTHNYRREVFRKAMRNFHAPMYGRYDNAIARTIGSRDEGGPYSYATLPWAAVSGGAALAWFAWAVRRPLEKRWDARSLGVVMAFMLAMIFFFALCEPWPMRMSLRISGYLEFQKDIASFAGVRDTLARYVEKMPGLEWYGQHYPPGNLILLTVERQLGIPGMTKSIVCLFTVLTIVPLYKLARELELDEVATSAALLLFAAASGVLIYPTINTTSLVLCPAVVCLWTLVRSLKSGSIAAAIVLGVSFAFYLFFSFSASILGVLMALTTAIGWWRGVFPTRHVIRAGVISVACVFATIAIVWGATRFNLIACFIGAVRGHQAQQGNEGFDDVQRWLLRSTGNLLAYATSIVPLSLLAVSALRRVVASAAGASAEARVAEPATARTDAPVLEYVTPATTERPIEIEHARDTVARALFVALIATVLVASFSGLFYVETERIWMFLTPAFALAAGYELSRRSAYEGRRIVHVVLLMALIIACTQEFFFQHYR